MLTLGTFLLLEILKNTLRLFFWLRHPLTVQYFFDWGIFTQHKYVTYVRAAALVSVRLPCLLARRYLTRPWASDEALLLLGTSEAPSKNVGTPCALCWVRGKFSADIVFIIQGLLSAASASKSLSSAQVLLYFYCKKNHELIYFQELI